MQPDHVRPCRQNEVDVGGALGPIYLRSVWLSGRATWRRVARKARARCGTKLRDGDFESVLKFDKLPRSVHEADDRRPAMQALILVEPLGGRIMSARIGVMRAC